MVTPKPKRFIVRVELLDVKNSEEESRSLYETLHEAMKKAGFSKQVKIESVTYELPMAEYYIKKLKTPDEILSLALAASKKTNHECRIWVSQLADFARHNLEEVKK